VTDTPGAKQAKRRDWYVDILRSRPPRYLGAHRSLICLRLIAGEWSR
jgi:hypothetical protein